MWDAPLNEAPLAFVDLEMTGLKPETDRVIQLCIERVAADRVDRLCSFVRPDELAADKPIGNVKFHGITHSDLEGAPSLASLAERIGVLLDGAVLVAHGARYDVAFLQAELARIGIPWSCSHYLDTLAISRRTLPEAKSHRLSALAVDLGLANPHPHRADNDVAVLRALFVELTRRAAAPTPRALWDLCKGKGRIRPGIIEAAKHCLTLGRSARVCYRPSGRSTQELLFQVTAVRTDLDPPVVLGYLQPTRGRRELRADRILTFEPLDDHERTS